MTVLPLAALAVLFGVPAVLRAATVTPTPELGSWIRLALGSGVLLVVQGVAISLALEEAHHEGYSLGRRGGLNRAPVLRGVRAPVGLAAVYLAGLWPLARLEPRKIWALGLYAGLSVVLVASGLLAERRGRAKRAREAGATPST